MQFYSGVWGNVYRYRYHMCMLSFRIISGKGQLRKSPRNSSLGLFPSVSHAHSLNRFFQYITSKWAPILTRWLVRKAQAAFQLTMQAVGSLTVADTRLKLNTVALHLSGLIWTASHPDKHKIRIIGFFSENRLHWLFEVRLLLFKVRTCVKTFRRCLI